jgi:hypothetical protein
LNFDLGGWVSNAKALVSVVELIKIPSQKEKLLKDIEGPKEKSIERHMERYEDGTIIFQGMDQNRGNGIYQPFFISLLVNNFLLHNCMLDSRDSSNVMTQKFMEQLNLRILRPYHNVCAMDSREIKVDGLIKDIQFHLVVYLDILVLMDVVVIGVCSCLESGKQVWGVVFKWIYHMLLSLLVITILLELIENKRRGTM